MQPTALSPYYASVIASVTDLSQQSGPWQKDAQSALANIDQANQTTDAFLDDLHKLYRLHRIAVAGLAQDEAFHQKITAENIGTWASYQSPPADESLQQELANKLYNIRPGKNDVGMLSLGDGARKIGVYLLDKCIASKTPVVVRFYDSVFQALLMNAADENGLKALGVDYVHMADPVTRIMTAIPGVPEVEAPKIDAEKSKIYAKETAAVAGRTSTGEVFYTLTVIPTRKDAEIDGIEYKAYTDLFFEMCDQPWDLISTAQKALIEEFNNASHVRITNNDGTDVSMSLIDHDGSHFTFCNSLIAKNVPGSEIFSAPRIDSVEGKIVAKGKFLNHADHLIENLTLEFEKGKLVRYHADKGVENFEAEINLDPGAKMIGELGIGTNPHLKQHVANGLLVEKIGGSFHLALGRCYSYTSYGDEPVKVDNGNKSALHWDITTMLFGKEGKIYLDGRLIMDDGFWIDPKYDVLNRGWQAVPEKDRPVYWQKKFKAA